MRKENYAMRAIEVDDLCWQSWWHRVGDLCVCRVEVEFDQEWRTSLWVMRFLLCVGMTSAHIRVKFVT